MAVDGTCPTCRKRVRIDNTTFKLAKHKGRDGKRCPGSDGWPQARGSGPGNG